MLCLYVFAGNLKAQDLVTLPINGQEIEMVGEARAIPSSFNLENIDLNEPYNFSYRSDGNDVLKFNMLKSERDLAFSGIDQNAVVDFYNGGDLVGSFPATDFPPAEVNGGPAAAVIIAVLVVACCVKVKYKKTIKNSDGSSTTTWEVSFDCDCLTISLKNSMPKINIRDRELAFTSFTISTTNKPVNPENLQLVITH